MGSDHCNYLIMVTSNHVHLLVVDDGDRNLIPRSMRLVAGRPGQEYNNPRPIEPEYNGIFETVAGLELLRALNRGMIPMHYMQEEYPKSLQAYVRDYLK